MDKKVVGYWITTALVALAFLVGGVFDALRLPDVVATFAHLGYPAYSALIIGVFKVAGAIVILAPKLPRLKEWAYAGIIIDLTGASASHAFVGDPVPNILVPLVIGGLAMGSWYLRPADRKL